MELTRKAERFIESRYSFLIFVGTGFALFSRAFFQFRAVLATTDSLFAHFPNIIFGYRSMRAGALPLWNPYIFAGTDFTTSMHNHMLDPFNWLLLLFPERYIFHALTVVIFAEVCLVGIFSFKIARLYLRDAWAALLVALVAQLSQFPWFTITTLIGIHLLTLSLASIYLILTWETRRKLVSYVLLSLCFFEIFMKGHIGYIAAFGVPIIVAFVIKAWPASLVRPWRGLTPLVLGAALTSVVMSAARILPVLQGLILEGRGVAGIWLPSLPGNSGYFILTALNPEVFGFTLGDSVGIFSRIGLTGRHTQFHQLMYFGVAPFFLLILTLRRNFGARPLAAALLLLGVAITPLYLMQPISDIFNILLFPFHIDIVPRAFTGYLVPLVLGLALFRCSREALEADQAAIRGFVVVVGLVLCASLALGIKTLHDWPGVAGSPGWPRLFESARVALAALLLVTVVAAWKLRFDVDSSRRISNATALAFLAAVVAAGALGLRQHLFTSNFITWQGFVYSLGVALWVLGVMILVRQNDEHGGIGRFAGWSAPSCLVVAMLMLVVPAAEKSGGRFAASLVIASALGAATMLLLVGATIEIFVRYRERRLAAAKLLPVLVLLTAGDLLFAVKDYEYVGASPFVTGDFLYPGAEHPADRRIELDDWRRAPARPNLLKNALLAGAKTALPGWSLGGNHTTLVTSPQAGEVGTAFTVADAGTLFQDVPLSDHPRSASFGAWVSTDKPGVVQVTLNGRGNGGGRFGEGSTFHTGGGAWEWLAATVSASGGLRSVRAHIAIVSPAIVRVFAPRLVEGTVVTPEGKPPEGAIKETPSLVLAEHGPTVLDLNSYRVNNQSRLTKNPNGEAFSNISMVYGLRTYGGVDSDVNQNLYDLLTDFEPPTDDWYGRGGFKPVLTNPRLLDLLGVRYDARPDGTVTERPNALARLSAFESYEVASSRQAMLARLKETDLDPTRTVLIDRAPDWPAPTAAAPRFRPLAFETPNVNELEAQLDLERPTIVLFDDSYSPYWHARWNGVEVPVMLANDNFMAVSLPAGRGTLSLAFLPQPFLTLAKVGAGATLLVLVLGAYAALTGWIARRRPLPAPRHDCHFTFRPARYNVHTRGRFCLEALCFYPLSREGLGQSNGFLMTTASGAE